MSMTFLKHFHDHVIASIHPSSSAPPDVVRVPEALPSIELRVPVSFRRLAGTAYSDVISQTGISAPAPMPTIESAIPTDKPGPPPARYLAKRPSTPDAY
jgi:hypothetical protein